MKYKLEDQGSFGTLNASRLLAACTALNGIPDAAVVNGVVIKVGNNSFEFNHPFIVEVRVKLVDNTLAVVSRYDQYNGPTRNGVRSSLMQYADLLDFYPNFTHTVDDNVVPSHLQTGDVVMWFDYTEDTLSNMILQGG